MSQKDLFDIPDDTPVDEEFVKEAEAKLSGISKDIISSKFEETKLIQASVADGGPSNTNEAIMNLMDYLGIGIRRLSLKVGVKRKILLRMLHGDIQMPHDIHEKITAYFRTVQPSLFDFEREQK